MNWESYKELNEELIEKERKKLVAIRKNDEKKEAELQEIESVKMECIALAKAICDQQNGYHGRALEKKGLGEYIPSKEHDYNIADLKAELQKEKRELQKSRQYLRELPGREAVQRETNDFYGKVHNFIYEQIIVDQMEGKNNNSDVKGYGTLDDFMNAMVETPEPDEQVSTGYHSDDDVSLHEGDSQYDSAPEDPEFVDLLLDDDF